MVLIILLFTTVASQMPMAKSLKCYKKEYILFGDMEVEECDTFCTNMTSEYLKKNIKENNSWLKERWAVKSSQLLNSPSVRMIEIKTFFNIQGVVSFWTSLIVE